MVMKILLDSGVVKYMNVFFLLSLFFAFLSSLVGFIFFGFFMISLSALYLLGYLFRTDERILSNGSIVSPTDGKVVSIQVVNELPDIINTANINYHGSYNMIVINSSLNNTYYKFSPADCVVESINIFFPKMINKNSNFIHKNYRTYISFKLRLINPAKTEIDYIMMIVEVLFADKNYNVYNLYVKEGETLKKGDLMICAHFYSNTWIYLKQQEINVQKGQSLFYKETNIIKP